MEDGDDLRMPEDPNEGNEEGVVADESKAVSKFSHEPRMAGNLIMRANGVLVVMIAGSQVYAGLEVLHVWEYILKICSFCFPSPRLYLFVCVRIYHYFLLIFYFLFLLIL